MGAYCLLIRNVRRRIEFTSYRLYDTGSKISHYRDLTVEDVPWPGVSEQTVYTRAYYRPMSWYVRALRTVGLVVTALEEPEPTEEFLASSPQGPWVAEIPVHCVIEAWKSMECKDPPTLRFEDVRKAL